MYFVRVCVRICVHVWCVHALMCPHTHAIWLSTWSAHQPIRMRTRKQVKPVDLSLADSFILGMATADVKKDKNVAALAKKAGAVALLWASENR